MIKMCPAQQNEPRKTIKSPLFIVVSTCIYCWSGCFLPPLGGTFETVGSRNPENYKDGLDLIKEMGASITNVETILFDLMNREGVETLAKTRALRKWLTEFTNLHEAYSREWHRLELLRAG